MQQMGPSRTNARPVPHRKTKRGGVLPPRGDATPFDRTGDFASHSRGQHAIRDFADAPANVPSPYDVRGGRFHPTPPWIIRGLSPTGSRQSLGLRTKPGNAVPRLAGATEHDVCHGHARRQIQRRGNPNPFAGNMLGRGRTTPACAGRETVALSRLELGTIARKWAANRLRLTQLPCAWRFPTKGRSKRRTGGGCVASTCLYSRLRL